MNGVGVKGIVVHQWGAVVALAIAVVLLAFAAVASHATTRRVCGSAKARTLGSTVEARVFTTDAHDTFVCGRKRRRSIRIPPESCSRSGECRLGTFSLSGSVVGYAFEAQPLSSGSPATDGVGVRDVDRATPTRTYAAYRPPVGIGGDDDSFAGVSIVRVSRTGLLAWIARNPQSPFGRTYEVHVVDRGGERLVASGLDIDTGSLRVEPRRVTWVSSGMRRSATPRS